MEDEWDEIQIRIDRPIAEDLLKSWDGVAPVPGIRGNGLEAAELIVIGLGTTADAVTLVMARHQVAELGRRVHAALTRNSGSTTVRLEIRQGSNHVKVTAQTGDPESLVAPLQQLVLGIGATDSKRE